MEKIVFLVEKLSTEETTLSSTMIDALALSDNFTSNYKVNRFQSHELEVANLKHNSEDIMVVCPHCNNWEQMSIDESRNHLQTFDLTEWLKESEEVERSLMLCHDCSTEFIQLWDYKKEEELEEISWDYYLDKSNIWMHGEDEVSDHGCVKARTKEEAREKAMAEMQSKIARINNKLEPLGVTLELNLEATLVVINAE